MRIMMPQEGRARVVIECVQPELEAGRFPTKRVVGEDVVVEAEILLVQQAHEHGLEIALDLAVQCSPEHPEWFRKRADGTVRYAENPPKRYEDIYPFDFECASWWELWQELKSVTMFWIEQGVRIFHVDNPHTKPFAFWERDTYQVHDLLSDVRFLWHGQRDYVELDPSIVPAHVFQVRRRVRTERDFDCYL